MNAINIIKNRRNDIIAVATDSDLYTVLNELVITEGADAIVYDMKVERFYDNFHSDTIKIDFEKLNIRF